MKRIAIYILLISIIVILNTSNAQHVKLGADLLFSDHFELINSKSVGVITNHTGLLGNGIHLIDTLINRSEVHLKAIFGPEHGIKGNAPDGASIKDDDIFKIPIYSLYGKVRKPTPEMLSGLDVLIFDIQDIGARYYTYISTLFNCLEAAAENNIPIIVLDRPNPINGLNVDGPLIDEGYNSFVATAPIPIVHGMTIGELALLFNEEKYLATENMAALTVVKMKNWKREYYYDDCGINWIKPSPNMPDLETAILYPGLCLLEGVNISEGRGTYSPFKQIGAPFIKSEILANEIRNIGLNSIAVLPVEYTPVSIDTMSKYPKYEGVSCHGVQLSVINRSNFESLRFGIQLLFIIKKLYPEEFEFRKNWLDRLYGSDKLSKSIEANAAPPDLFSSWDIQLNKFKEVREKYLLY